MSLPVASRSSITRLVGIAPGGSPRTTRSPLPTAVMDVPVPNTRVLPAVSGITARLLCSSVGPR
jgi:hypothetical protein